MASMEEDLSWMIKQAKEELQILEAQHPNRFAYLKMELRNFIHGEAETPPLGYFPKTVVSYRDDYNSSMPNSSATTQVSSNGKRRKVSEIQNQEVNQEQRSAEKMARFDKRNELPLELREEQQAVDAIFREALGDYGHGRVHCLGYGVKPKQVGLTKANLKVQHQLRKSLSQMEERMLQTLTQRENQMKEELKLEMKQEIKEELKLEMKQEIKEELKLEMKQEIEAQLAGMRAQFAQWSEIMARQDSQSSVNPRED